eukprot:14900110-Alexandrium_andersonii.AAC.1
MPRAGATPAPSTEWRRALSARCGEASECRRRSRADSSACGLKSVGLLKWVGKWRLKSSDPV